MAEFIAVVFGIVWFIITAASLGIFSNRLPIYYLKQEEEDNEEK